MKIMGIDPGYGRCGYAVLEKKTELTIQGFGVITTEHHTNFLLRIEEIAADFESLLKKYKPDLICIEDLFFVNNITTGIKVAEVRGILLYISGKFKIQVAEPKPVEIKSVFTGNGAASKSEIKKMCQILFGLEITPRVDDAADAIATAFWGTTHVLQKA